MTHTSLQPPPPPLSPFIPLLDPMHPHIRLSSLTLTPNIPSSPPISLPFSSPLIPSSSLPHPSHPHSSHLHSLVSLFLILSPSHPHSSHPHSSHLIPSSPYSSSSPPHTLSPPQPSWWSPPPLVTHLAVDQCWWRQ